MKGILSPYSIELASARQLFFDEEESLLNLIDSIDIIRAASCLVSKDHWNALSSILKTISDRYDINFCVYENRHGLLFDVTNENIYANSDSELLRLEFEQEQIENEIADLQAKLIVINQRIKNLNSLESFYRSKINVNSL
jgi:peptidoglycan hydrolase CwlO-like protein